MRATEAMAKLSSSVSRCSKAPRGWPEMGVDVGRKGRLARDGRGCGQEGRVGERWAWVWAGRAAWREMGVDVGRKGRLARDGCECGQEGWVGERWAWMWTGRAG